MVFDRNSSGTRPEKKDFDQDPVLDRIEIQLKKVEFKQNLQKILI